jgi:hypothetical protein
VPELKTIGPTKLQEMEKKQMVIKSVQNIIVPQSNVCTKAEIAATVAKSIKQLGEWFKKNPKRKSCNALWYNKTIKVRRAHIAEDVKAAAKKVY